jgi:urease gamma subunit
MHILPDKAHAEEGREIEAEILQFFPSNCQREKITQHVTEMIKHVQETSFPDTPIWVKVTQHKEK